MGAWLPPPRFQSMLLAAGGPRQRLVTGQRRAGSSPAVPCTAAGSRGCPGYRAPGGDSACLDLPALYLCFMVKVVKKVGELLAT